MALQTPSTTPLEYLLETLLRTGEFPGFSGHDADVHADEKKESESEPDYRDYQDKGRDKERDQ
jgi:hypothetical protein